jgi:O-antigen/teichoic acid export membrane protein
VDLTPISHASLFVKFGMLVCAAPLVAGVLYAVRPNDRRLALMRPLSLAAIFASVSTLLLGVANALLHIGKTASGASATGQPAAATILAEAVVPSFVGFACLTVAWLAVSIGVRKSA